MTHPNTLVGITTARIAFTEVPNTPRINMDMHSSIKGDDARFIFVLDAFAALAVSSVKGQVVAMAMQQSSGRAIITIAENKEVKKGLREHIVDLLTKLNGIAIAPPALLEARQREFIKATYGYSLTKLHKRFTGRTWLPKFEREFKNTDEKGIKLISIVSSLMTVRQALERMKKRGGKNPERVLKDPEWDELIFLMAAGIPDVDELLKERSILDAWAVEIQGTVWQESRPPGQRLPVPLFRTISKLTSHHRHIAHLFSYAKSYLGKKDLACDITVNDKPMETVIAEIRFPPIPEVRAIVKGILPPTADLAAEMKVIQEAVATNFGKPLDETTAVVFPGAVHCECALITMFNLEPHPARWPINYIGVSKLSCAACYAWIHAFNATHPNNQYQTGGSHGRWYPKWAIPTLPAPQQAAIQAEMNDNVDDAYLNFYNSLDRVRTIEFSDSTEAKGMLPGVIWSGEKLRKRISMTKTQRDERATKPLPT